MAEILPSPRTAATTTAAKMFGRCSDRVQNVFRRCAEGDQMVVQRIKNSPATTFVKIGAPAQQVVIEMKEIQEEVIEEIENVRNIKNLLQDGIEA